MISLCTTTLLYEDIFIFFFLQPLEQVETLSDIVDNENAVDDLSDDETKEPRLILPKLRPDKKDKRRVSWF